MYCFDMIWFMTCRRANGAPFYLYGKFICRTLYIIFLVLIMKSCFLVLLRYRLHWNETKYLRRINRDNDKKNGIFHTLLHPPLPTVSIHALRTCNKILLKLNYPSKFPTKKKSGSLTVIGKKQQSAFKKKLSAFN